MENKPLLDKSLKEELSELYRAPDRHYHGLAHVEALLELGASTMATCLRTRKRSKRRSGFTTRSTTAEEATMSI